MKFERYLNLNLNKIYSEFERKVQYYKDKKKFK